MPSPRVAQRSALKAVSRALNQPHLVTSKLLRVRMENLPSMPTATSSCPKIGEGQSKSSPTRQKCREQSHMTLARNKFHRVNRSTPARERLWQNKSVMLDFQSGCEASYYQPEKEHEPHRASNPYQVVCTSTEPAVPQEWCGQFDASRGITGRNVRYTM